MSENKHNPLAFLDDLLEEERASSEYFGWVGFWKHFEYIEVPHIYKPSSLEYRNLKLMCFEMVFYVLWVMVLTLYIIANAGSDSMNIEAMNNQLYYWGGCILEDCEMRKVVDTESMWWWMENELIPRAFSDQDFYAPLSDLPAIYALNEKSVGWKPRYVGDTKTVIQLGGIRVRQLRVKKNSGGSCRAKREELKELHDECFAKYEEKYESKLKYAKMWTPGYILKHFTWSPANRTNQIAMEGHHGSYPGSGFYFDLPLNRTNATILLRDLKEWDWINVNTRAIVLELTVVNPNTNILVNNRILFEYGAYGKVDILHNAYPFRSSMMSLSLIANDEPEYFTYKFIGYSIFLLYLFMTLWYWWKNGLEFLWYVWNLMDLLILFLVVQYMSTQKQTLDMAHKETVFLPEMLGIPEFFFPFSKLIALLTHADGLLAFLGVFSWLRLLKYLTLFNTFRLLLRCLERAVYALFMFAVLGALVMFGFAIAFHVGFYNQDGMEEFRYLSSSFFTLVFMLARGVSISKLFESNHWLAPAVFSSYLLIIYLLLLNMFMGLVLDVYTIVTFARHAKLVNKQFANDSVWACWLISYFGKMRGDVFVPPDETDDDRGRLDEQFIEVDLLPDVMQHAWSGKRAQIKALVESKMGEMGENQDVQRLKREFEEFDAKGVISRVQIQRLLEEDVNLQFVVGTDKAIDVIRRFSMPEYANTQEEAFDEITRLQENVFTKLEEYESEHKLEFGCVESLKLVSTGLHEALTDVQNQWRNELTSVLESTNSLATTLTAMAKKLEAVQMNHTSIVHEAGLQQIVNSNAEVQRVSLPGGSGSE